MDAAASAPNRAVLAELQDELMIATTDLDRLQSLLANAVEQLMGRFVGVDALLEQAASPDVASSNGAKMPVSRDRLVDARSELGGAVVALQFQDLAAQLLSHALHRVRSVADCLGNYAMPAEADGAADGIEVQFVARACPVAQRQMDAGSIELY